MIREDDDGIFVALDLQTLSFGFCVSTEWEVVFLGGTTLAEVIPVKGDELPTIVKVLPVGFDSQLLVEHFNPVGDNTCVLESVVDDSTCLMLLEDVIAYHATTIPKITSSFTTPTPPPPSFFNPLSQQATPTPTPTTFEATTTFTYLPNFTSIFKFNERVTHLGKDLSEIKQVDQYAQAFSSIPAIVDHYMDNKHGEAISKAIQAYNFDCRDETQAEKKGKNVTESLEAAVLTRSSSQPQSSYEVVATLSEFELTKILIDKMEKNKSFNVADYKRELYDALVKSYNTNKDIFESYGEVFLLKRSRDERDKEQDPSAGSDRGTKRRKSSKDDVSSRDSRSKEKKSSSTSKDASQSQHVFRQYDYGHLEEIEVRRDDQQLYTFKEGDFKRLCLEDIEDMLLLLVQQKLTNLTIDERYDLNVALHHNKRKRLMRADELHKFSDGTFIDVRSALHNIVAGIRMEYPPMRKWSNLDKKRARVMVQDIEKQLYQRRLMRNLEKFVGGRVYRNDLRILERTI
nr:hypothetical protein [Tanacetum cinerariifolium]